MKIPKTQRRSNSHVNGRDSREPDGGLLFCKFNVLSSLARSLTGNIKFKLMRLLCNIKSVQA